MTVLLPQQRGLQNCQVLRTEKLKEEWGTEKDDWVNNQRNNYLPLVLCFKKEADKMLRKGNAENKCFEI